MLVSRTGLSPVMVGRDHELAHLRRLAASPSGPTVALIGGEPGIGKTRLASELTRALASPTTTNLACQADPAGFGEPYRLLLDLADGGREELAGLVTIIRDGDPAARHRAARDLLRALLGEQPAVLVVDDLHWADPDSLEVLTQVDEIACGPLLVVATYRPDEVSHRHPLAKVLERIDRRRGVTHLRLERLAPADTARFLAAVYGRTPRRRIVTALHQRTGGNPFFLEELLKAAGDTDLDEIHTQPLPWNLAEALRSQMDGLAPDRRRVVEAAAVLGARVSFDLLAAVTGLSEAAMVAALRDLVDRGLMVEAEDDQFGFRHALTREAVAGELLARQRRRLHEAALDALLAAPQPDVAAVAVHAHGAGRYQEMIAAAGKGAAERLAAGSPHGALSLAELALDEAPDHVELLSLAAIAAWRAGFPADAARYATRVLEVATDDGDRVVALSQLVRASYEQGELSEMDHYTERLRELTEALPDGDVRAQALAAVAQSYMLRGGPGDPVAWAERACAVADRLGLKDVRLAALVEKGTTLLRDPAAADAGRKLLTEVAAEAEHAGAYFTAARGWGNLFWGRPTGDGSSLALLERMRSNAERAGAAGMALGSYHAGRARLAHRAGDLDGAIAVLEEAERTGRTTAAVDPATGAPAEVYLGLSAGKTVRGRLIEQYLERGDLDAAETLLAEAHPSRRWKHTARRLAFQLAARRGNRARAEELLASILDVPAGADSPSPAAAIHCQVAAGLAAGLSPAQLHPLLDRARATPGADPPDDPMWVLVRAQLAEAGEDHDRALAAYQRVAATATLAPPYRGTAAVRAARCLIGRGRLDEAREQVATAADLLARWGGWRRRELDAVSRRLGVATGDGTGESVLTPREREVAALLGEGLTNAEIARRLVISRKTVAVHVSHILAKLEMSSRAQVAAWVARHAR